MGQHGCREATGGRERGDSFQQCYEEMEKKLSGFGSSTERMMARCMEMMGRGEPAAEQQDGATGCDSTLARMMARWVGMMKPEPPPARDREQDRG